MLSRKCHYHLITKEFAGIHPQPGGSLKAAGFGDGGRNHPQAPQGIPKGLPLEAATLGHKCTNLSVRKYYFAGDGLKAVNLRQPLFLSFALFFLTSAAAMAQDFVPFVIPARPNLESPIAISTFEPIGTDDESLRAIDGHFYRSGRRIRIWGVNLSFGANMPTHADAPYVAARLAAAGVNSIRCHHMDTSRWPRGLWNSRDGKTIEPEALDRLDFFINELARRGICVNINLHVGRAHSEYLGLPEANRKYDKINNLFTPELIEAQKDFARQLLGRVNPYRKVRYADDPAVAFVEITNENSFFMWSSEETLRTLPPYYAGILKKKYNAWLRQKYGSDEKLRKAWSVGAESLGANILDNGNLKEFPPSIRTPSGWQLEQHGECRASVSIRRYQSRDALRFEISRADPTEWHLQFTQNDLALKAGRYYTAIFDAASERPRKISCGVSQAHEPWANLGLSRHADLTQQWKTFRFGFIAKDDDENSRLSFAFGGSDVPFYLANVQLRPGGRVGLARNESTRDGSVALYADNEGPQRAIDRMRFLAETEKSYFDDMRSFIRNDLGCKALVTGTIVFGPLGLYAQSDMDFIDAHAYWQHPRFPGRPWDQGNWLVDQKPMVDYPEQSPLSRLAAQRLEGKPYTVSEYNHPAPLDSQAECVPMIASFGALQDWDGIWLYTYSHGSDDWYRESMNSFFDIDSNPAKWGFMRAGTAIFRDAAIKPFGGRLVISLGKSRDILADLAKQHLECDQDMWDVVSETSGPPERTELNWRIHLSIPGKAETASRLKGGTPSPRLTWSVDNGKGVYMAAGGAGVLAGHAGKLSQNSDGYARIRSPEYAVITATPLDGVSWPRSNKILITACGRCENTGMEFSGDRRTVGRQWGGAPVRIETVEGTVMIPVGRWSCRALRPDGTVKMDVPVRTAGAVNYVDMSPKYGTMWYLLTRQ